MLDSILLNLLVRITLLISRITALNNNKKKNKHFYLILISLNSPPSGAHTINEFIYNGLYLNYLLVIRNEFEKQ